MHVLVPLFVLVPELLPMFGDVVIVQLIGFPSGSWIVMLKVDVVIGIPVDPLVGFGFVIVGGLLTGVVTPGGGIYIPVRVFLSL